MVWIKYWAECLETEWVCQCVDIKGAVWPLQILSEQLWWLILKADSVQSVSRLNVSFSAPLCVVRDDWALSVLEIISTVRSKLPTSSVPDTASTRGPSPFLGENARCRSYWCRIFMFVCQTTLCSEARDVWFLIMASNQTSQLFLALYLRLTESKTFPALRLQNAIVQTFNKYL